MATSSTSGTSSYSYLLNGTSNRMSGLASGLDTTSMVNSLMKAERIPLDKLNQKKTKLQWKQSVELEVNNLLRDFKDKYMSMLNKDSNMLSASNIKANKVTMGSSSIVVGITATSDAAAGSHVVNSVTSIAAGAGASSTASVSAVMLSASSSLANLALTTPLTFDNGALSFSINGKTFTFQSTDSLQQVMNTVNSDITANATLSYSQLTGKFSLVSKTMGSASNLVVGNIKGNFFGYTDSNNQAVPSAIGINEGTYHNGTDAVISIDGTTVTKSSNNFTIDGMTYSLTGTTASEVSFSVSRDIEGAITKIRDFVNSYNTLIDKLNAKINEKTYVDYTPLTDAQKADMSDTEISQWEEKAKSGLLHRDSNLSNLLNTMRSAFYTTVQSAGTSAASIGFPTESYADDDGKISLSDTKLNGKIDFNETILRDALINNPDQVISLFTATSTSTDAATRSKESGLVVRMQTALNSYLSDYTTNRAQIESDQLSDLDVDIDNMTSRLQDREERYWRKFDALEAAMEKFNSQSAWLAQQFSSSGS